MRVTLWGTRGSVASPGPDTVGYGGNTACAEVRSSSDSLLVLDAGTGMRRLGVPLEGQGGAVHVLLSHLHVDHIQGLGFFGPLFEPGREVHIWGPASTTLDLRARLARYLSPPLFPIPIRELPCRLLLHDTPLGRFEIDCFELTAELVCHPGPTVGYRIACDGESIAYLPDHEPALGDRNFPGRPDWVSGFSLASGVDLLIHDAQYTAEEYPDRVGWGHSSIPQMLAFAALAGVRKLVTFHHDPAHPDTVLDRIHEEIRETSGLSFEVLPGYEGATFSASE